MRTRESPSIHQCPELFLSVIFLMETHEQEVPLFGHFSQSFEIAASRRSGSSRRRPFGTNLHNWFTEYVDIQLREDFRLALKSNVSACTRDIRSIIVLQVPHDHHLYQRRQQGHRLALYTPPPAPSCQSPGGPHPKPKAMFREFHADRSSDWDG